MRKQLTSLDSDVLVISDDDTEPSIRVEARRQVKEEQRSPPPSLRNVPRIPSHFVDQDVVEISRPPSTNALSRKRPRINSYFDYDSDDPVYKERSRTRVKPDRESASPSSDEPSASMVKIALEPLPPIQVPSGGFRYDSAKKKRAANGQKKRNILLRNSEKDKQNQEKGDHQKYKPSEKVEVIEVNSDSDTPTPIQKKAPAPQSHLSRPAQPFSKSRTVTHISIGVQTTFQTTVGVQTLPVSRVEASAQAAPGSHAEGRIRDARKSYVSVCVQAKPPLMNLDLYGQGRNPPRILYKPCFNGLLELYADGPQSESLYKSLLRARSFLNKAQNLHSGNYQSLYWFVDGIIRESNIARFNRQRLGIEQDPSDPDFHVRKIYDWMCYYVAYGQDVVRRLTSFFDDSMTQPDGEKRIRFYAQLSELLGRVHEVIGLILARVGVARHYLQRLDMPVHRSTYLEYPEVWKDLNMWWGFADDEMYDDFGGLLPNDTAVD